MSSVVPLDASMSKSFFSLQDLFFPMFNRLVRIRNWLVSSADSNWSIMLSFVDCFGIVLVMMEPPNCETGLEQKRHSFTKLNSNSEDLSSTY